MNKIQAYIDAYINHYMILEEKELDFFRKSKSLEESIINATKAIDFNGKRLSHQRRLKIQVLETMAKKLLNRKQDFINSTCFDEIYAIVNEERIFGFGKLAIYDTSLRISAYQNIEPDSVYLHAGTKKGAKNIGVNTFGKKQLKLNDLPLEFQKAINNNSIGYKHIEDILCIFKDRLKQKN